MSENLNSAFYENVFTVDLATGITCENDKIYTILTSDCPDIEFRLCCANEPETTESTSSATTTTGATTQAMVKSQNYPP
jgi:hypothetical protein